MINVLLKISLIICTAVFMLSCEKSNDYPENTITQKKYDTIFPLPYLPEYPGSYWIYDYYDRWNDYHNVDCMFTDTAYHLYSYLINEQTYSDTVYVPFSYNYLIGYFLADHYTYEYSIAYVDDSYNPDKVISTVLDEEWFVWTDDRIEEVSAKTTYVDTSIYVNNNLYDSIIIIEYYNYPICCSVNKNDYLSYRKYFAKNIGLIKNENFVRWEDSLIIFNEYLIKDYYINKRCPTRGSTH